jgi:RNA polymerase sigma factor (sigma-70 family)
VIANSRADDADVLRRISKSTLRAMTNVAARYERDTRDVEEIVADALELAHRHRNHLSSADEMQVRSWLLRTVRYLAMNHVRRSMARRRALYRLAREPLDLVASPEDEYLATEQAEETAATSQRISEALGGLDPRYRTVLVMSALGSSSTEIGEAINASSGAARKVLQRARDAFRAEWPDDVWPPQESSGSRRDG